MHSNFRPAEKHSLGPETKGIKSHLSAEVHSARIGEGKTKGQSPETESEAIKAVAEESKQTAGQW